MIDQPDNIRGMTLAESESDADFMIRLDAQWRALQHDALPELPPFDENSRYDEHFPNACIDPGDAWTEHLTPNM